MSGSFSEITAHGGLGVETIFNQSISLSFLLITPSLLPSPLYLLSFHPLSLSVYCFRSSYFPTFPYPSLILFSFSLYPFHITLSVLCPIFPPPSLSLSHHLLLLFPSCKIQLHVRVSLFNSDPQPFYMFFSCPLSTFSAPPPPLPFLFFSPLSP